MKPILAVILGLIVQAGSAMAEEWPSALSGEAVFVDACGRCHQSAEVTGALAGDPEGVRADLNAFLPRHHAPPDPAAFETLTDWLVEQAAGR